MPTPANSLNITEGGVVTFDGVSIFHGRTLTAGAGITITNGSGISGNPTIALTGGGVAVEHLTGNSGGALNPDGSNNFNILTANATPKFAGSGSTLTQDFGLTNLMLGSSSTSITSAARNVAFGLSDLNLLTSGTDNTAIGFNALKSVTTSSLNTAVGAFSQQTLSTGATGNTSIGYSCLSLNTGSNNTALGYSSMSLCTTGSENCAVGTGSLGTIVTGTNNIGVGPSSFNGATLSGADSSNICIGHPGISGDNNTIRLGKSGSGTSQQNKCFIAGMYNIAIGATNLPLMVDSTDQVGTNNAGNSGIGYVAGTLTNAQIKALHATPITIVAAQGSGTLIRIISWTGRFNYGGTNVFTAGAGQTIAFYLSTSNTLSASLISNATLTGSTSIYALGNALPSTFTVAGENQPLILYNSNATEITGNAANDNTISYNVVYQVIKI